MFRRLKNQPLANNSAEEILKLINHHFKAEMDEGAEERKLDMTDYLLYKENLPSLCKATRLITRQGEIVFLEMDAIRDRTS